MCRSDNHFGQIYRDMGPTNRIKRSFAQMSVVSLMRILNLFNVSVPLCNIFNEAAYRYISGRTQDLRNDVEEIEE